MRVIAKRTINLWREKYPKASGALQAWVEIIQSRDFKHFPDLKSAFGSADLVKKDRVVFNIMGNHFRLIAGVDFQRQAVFSVWFGTHREYDKINPAEVAYEHPSH